MTTTRSGIGYDSHRLEAGRRLVLGGVEIPRAELGLAGHSDADVLTHAIIDALLGAAGLGDIGQHFPDTDPSFAGADSMRLLASALTLVAARGLRPAGVDATVICERPKLGPHREAIGQSLAEALGTDAVNVKFTTNEGMGAIGRGEGIATLAIATLEHSA
ncbi:MAG: 2-C-methyl-D-erythritol 2,4-cyclodiphosphate synthase [Thermoleophilaceae bacterium]